jgi:hypothetical protein
MLGLARAIPCHPQPCSPVLVLGQPVPSLGWPGPVLGATDGVGPYHDPPAGLSRGRGENDEQAHKTRLGNHFIQIMKTWEQFFFLINACGS